MTAGVPWCCSLLSTCFPALSTPRLVSWPIVAIVGAGSKGRGLLLRRLGLGRCVSAQLQSMLMNSHHRGRASGSRNYCISRPVVKRSSLTHLRCKESRRLAMFHQMVRRGRDALAHLQSRRRGINRARAAGAMLLLQEARGSGGRGHGKLEALMERWASCRRRWGG